MATTDGFTSDTIEETAYDADALRHSTLQAVHKADPAIPLTDNLAIEAYIELVSNPKTPEAFKTMARDNIFSGAADSGKKAEVMRNLELSGAAGMVAGIAETNGDKSKKEEKEKEARREAQRTFESITLSNSLANGIADFSKSIFDDLFSSFGGDIEKMRNMTEEELRLHLEQNPSAEWNSIVNQMKRENPGADAEAEAVKRLKESLQENLAELENARSELEKNVNQTKGAQFDAIAEIGRIEELSATDGNAAAIEKIIESSTPLDELQALLLSQVDQFGELSGIRDELAAKIQDNPELRRYAPDYIAEIEEQIAQIDIEIQGYEDTIAMNNELAYFIGNEDIANMSVSQIIYASQKEEYSGLREATERAIGQEAAGQLLAQAFQAQGISADKISEYMSVAATIGKSQAELTTLRADFDTPENAVLRGDDFGLPEGSYIFSDGNDGFIVMDAGFVSQDTTFSVVDPSAIQSINAAIEGGARIGTAEDATAYKTSGLALTGAQIDQNIAIIEENTPEGIADAEIDALEAEKAAIESGANEAPAPAPSELENLILSKKAVIQAFVGQDSRKHGVPEADLREFLKDTGIPERHIDSMVVKAEEWGANVSPRLETPVIGASLRSAFPAAPPSQSFAFNNAVQGPTNPVMAPQEQQLEMAKAAPEQSVGAPTTPTSVIGA